MPESSMFTEAWLPGPDGHQFYTRTYNSLGPAQAVILFIHGFAEHIARHEQPHSTWASRGFTVFTFDQRGFGRTALNPEHRSKGSAFGKTCFREQMQDIEWWVQYLKKDYPDVPLYLMGHSMGGALALAFPTREKGPPSQETVDMISGVISASPLILQTFPASKLLRWAGGKAAILLPWISFPALVPLEDISHDAAVNEAVPRDPLHKDKGTLRGLTDMFNVGEQLLWYEYRNWPRSLPVLILHGTADRVTSSKASEEFFDKLVAEDKKISLYPNAYHELSNEPDGVKEKFIGECISWVQVHLPRSDHDTRLSQL